METYEIPVIGGDGTGPEVVAEAMKVVKAAGEKHDFKLDFHMLDYGGDRYIKTGEIISDEEVNDLRNYKAILLGAIGHPDVKPGILEKGILLKIRFDLDQYINLRPVRLYEGVETPIKGKKEEDIQFTVVRENTGGIYSGIGGSAMKGTPNEVAVQSMVYNRHQVDRCLKWAFEYTAKNGKKAKGVGEQNTLALCGKTNVLTEVYDLWERAFHEMGEKEFPDIKRDYYHVDATCMWMIKNPEWFDVIVTGNMFGDIITDLGAMVQGGMGIAAGANINPEGGSMFEPIGGSAPKYTGQNVINPLASIESGRMMLDYLGEDEAAVSVGKAVKDFLKSGRLKGLSASAVKESGLSTEEIGDIIAENI